MATRTKSKQPSRKSGSKSAVAPEPRAVSIPMPDEGEMADSRDALVTTGNGFLVRTPGEYQSAMKFVGDCKARVKTIEAHFAPAKSALNVAKKQFDDAIKGLTSPIVAVQNHVWTLALQWERAQRAREEEARRLATEQARQAEEARRKKEAEAARKAGDEGLAKEITSAPIEVAVFEVKSAVPTSTAVGRQKVWQAEVLDFQQLLNHVAAHPEYINLVQPNQVALNELARAQHEALKIPGVRAKFDEVPRGK